MSAPSSAQEPMLEPAGPANAVPPISVTKDRRAGTSPSSLSAASKQRRARPVWKNSAPISRNIGIGTSANEVIAPKPLLMICMMPAAPPMNSSAAIRLAATNAIATGMPSIIRPTLRPNRMAAAQYHSISAKRAEEILAAQHEAQELEPHHAEAERDEADHHPARHVEGADVLLVLQEVVQRHREAVPGDHCADHDADEADQQREARPHARRERHQHDLD